MGVVEPLHRVSPHKNAAFPRPEKDAFADAYPEKPVKLRHQVSNHALLTLPSLAQLATTLPDTAIEYNRGDVPIGVEGKPAPNGLTIEQTILEIERSGSWAVLKNIENHRSYARLLDTLLAELRPTIERATGPMLRPQGFVFISSPGAVTPYHFDPEHNLLLQIKGRKVMTQFPAGDCRFAAHTAHEAYHSGGARELAWDDDLAGHGTPFTLAAGDALHVPVMAPHYVRNGPSSSISLSITWRSEWSYGEGDARAFNARLRRLGLSPRPPARWPGQNRFKATAHRALRKLLPVY